MTGYSSGGSSVHSEAAKSLSVPYLVLAAVLSGIGLFGVTYWIVTFQWVYFASVIPLIAGAYMLFTRGTGPDHA